MSKNPFISPPPKPKHKKSKKEDKKKKKELESQLSQAAKSPSDKQGPSWSDPDNDNDNNGTDGARSTSAAWTTTTSTSEWTAEAESDELDDEFTLTERDKELLAQDPAFVFPTPNPIPASPYWSEMIKDVIIDEAVNPNDFFIRNERTSKELQTLEEAMYEYYQANWKICKLFTMNEIVLNGFYAVYSFESGGWHRAKIMCPVGRDDARHSDELLVFMVDHGKNDIITLECIAYLRQQYVELPIQAAWAQLHIPGIENVKQWSDDIVKTFKEDVEGKSFGAIIKKVGHSSSKQMTRVKIVLTHTVDNQQRIYTFHDRLQVGLIRKSKKKH
jgi:hypothetical protein